MTKQCSTCHFYFLQKDVGKCKATALATLPKNTSFNMLVYNVVWLYESVPENHCCSSYQEKESGE